MGETVEIDVRGLSCPLPVMETTKALKASPRHLRVLADSGTAKANVVHLLEDAGFSVSVDDSSGDYRIEASRP